MGSNVMLRLTETDGGGNSSELSKIEVSSSTTTIGRSNEADICFGDDDQSVSRLQFEVSFSGGEPTLKNTGRNPVVYKNGKKQLAPGAHTNIVSGLEVTFREGKLRFDVEVPSAYCLKTKGAEGRAEFEIESDRKYTVGRSPECDITLDSSGVSRRHCKLQIGSSEILAVHDLGSVNGVRLILKGEVQEESSDIEVPCGEKFIIGDIECMLEKEGQGSSGKKKIVVPIILVLLLIVATIAFFVLNPQSESDVPNQGGGSDIAITNATGPIEITNNPAPPEPLPNVNSEHQQNIDRIQDIIQNDNSFYDKANQFAVLAKDPDMKELKPVIEQLVEYYSQCTVVKKLNASLSEEYKQQKEETKNSINQMEFDFRTSLSFKELKEASKKLGDTYEAASELLKGSDSEVKLKSHIKLINVADELVEKVAEYGELARSCSFMWTDLENSLFASSKFDKEKMMDSIDDLYPGEGIGAEVCAKIDEIIAYLEQMAVVYQGLIGQISSVLTNFSESGVSAQLVPERWALEPLREGIGATRPKYFVDPPPITEVSSTLYSYLDGISAEWTSLEFLAHCGRWRSDLEQSKKDVAKLDEEVIPLIDELCTEALDKGLSPHRKIKSGLEADEELDFNDADDLIKIYNQCYECLQNKLFCDLRKESKKEMEAVSADILNSLYEQLKKECDSGLYAKDASETGVFVQNAKRILELLDSAVSLPQEFEATIKEYRVWVESF